MLKMLQFNQDRQEKGIINIPSYTSCPGLKHGVQQTNTFNVQSNEQMFEQQQESPKQQFHFVKKFDYNQYMFELQNKLGEQNFFSSYNGTKQIRISGEAENLGRQVNYQNQQAGRLLDSSFTVQSNSKGFREKILQKLGNAQLEDSNVQSADEYASADFLSNQNK